VVNWIGWLCNARIIAAFEVLSRHLSETTGENHETSVGINGILAKIEIEHIPNRGVSA
jgi:hypothetical protein